MKRLWIQLSVAIALVVLLASSLSFVIVFALSWLIPDPLPSIEHIQGHYIHDALPFIEQEIIEGKSDEEIIQQLQVSSELELRNVLKEARAYGYAKGVDATDRSFGRIFSDFVREFFGDGFVEVLFYAAITGIGAGIISSRRFAKPLEELTHSVQQFGIERESRVQVAGSQEIENLGVAFNTMADKLEQQEILRRNMLADVSHELRTPLSVLEGQLRGTLDGVFELNEERLAGYYQQTNHLIRLVEDLRLLAQAEAKRLPLDTTDVDVNAVLQQTLELFQFEAESQGVFIVLDVPDTVLILHTDEQRFRQILHNLIVNALRHTPLGGTISLYAKQADSEVIVGVKDSGEGIPREQLGQIFDRFYRVDKARARESGGSGLGLAIVKSLVEMMGGSIQAESAGLGQGTEIYMNLPYVNVTR